MKIERGSVAVSPLLCHMAMVGLGVLGMFPFCLFPLCMLSLCMLSGCENAESLRSETDGAGNTAADSTVDELLPNPLSSPPIGDEFAEPVRLMAGEEFVSVDSPGYACPTMADVDQDGKLDLVVGQFKNGAMHFYKNVSDNSDEIKFASHDWIMTDDEQAKVPGVW